jgi:release factor glutamine methyltransferase
LSSAASIGAALKAASERIEGRDAEYLLCALLNVSRASLRVHGEQSLTADQAAQFADWAARRECGEPVAYILGKREFYGRNFFVGPDVLIPRPETEHLLEQALARLSSHLCLESPANARVLDLGTGSGAVAISVALECPKAQVLASDVSPKALAIARSNARLLGAAVEFVESNWFDAFEGRTFDLIVSNPPYVAGNDQHLKRGDLRFEPTTALTDGSVDGLASIRHIAAEARRHLAPGGALMIEHGYDQASWVRDILLNNGYSAPTSVKDLAGIARVAVATIG